MKIFKHTLKTILLLATIISCSSNSSEISQEEQDRLELDNLKEEIEQLIAEGTCSDNTTCSFIPFGSKPCGGPWSYLVFSSSIDVGLLKEKVAIYNEKEDAFNIKWSKMSDCSAVLPPISVECVNGECTAVY